MPSHRKMTPPTPQDERAAVVGAAAFVGGSIVVVDVDDDVDEDATTGSEGGFASPEIAKANDESRRSSSSSSSSHGEGGDNGGVRGKHDDDGRRTIADEAAIAYAPPPSSNRIRTRRRRHRRHLENNVDDDVDDDEDDEDDEDDDGGDDRDWLSSSSSSSAEIRQAPSPPDDATSFYESTAGRRRMDMIAGGMTTTTTTMRSSGTGGREDGDAGRGAREYEVAIRRALDENEYYRSVNGKLMRALRSTFGNGGGGDMDGGGRGGGGGRMDDDEGGDDADGDDATMDLASACDDMKALIVELSESYRISQTNLSELSQRHLEEKEKWEIRDRAMLDREGEFVELRNLLYSARDELNRVRRERDEARCEKRVGGDADGDGGDSDTTTEEADDDDEDDEDAARERERDDLIRMVIEEERATFALERESYANAMAVIEEERDMWRARHDDIMEARLRDAEASSHPGSVSAPSSSPEHVDADEKDHMEERRVLIATNIELEATIDLLAKDSDGWQSKYVSTIEYASKLENDRDDLRRSLDDERTKSIKVMEERDELLMEVSALRKDVVEMANEVTKVGNERESLSRERDVLALDNRSLRDGMNDVEASHTREKEGLRMEVESLRREIREAAKAREEEVLELCAMNGADKRALEDAEYILSELTGKVAAYEVMCEKITGLVGGERKRRVDGDGPMDDETEKLTGREKLVDSVATLVGERDGLIVQVEELQRGGIECCSLIEDLHSQLASSRSELSDIARRLEYAEAEARAFTKERDDLFAENSAFREQSETHHRNETNYRAVIEDLQSRLVASNEVLSMFSQRIMSVDANTRSLLKESDLLAENCTLRESVDIHQSLDTDMRLKNEREIWDVYVDELVTQNEETSKRIDELVRAVDRGNEKCSESAAALDEIKSATRGHSHVKALGADVQELKPEEYEILCQSTDMSECVLDESSLETNALGKKM